MAVHPTSYHFSSMVNAGGDTIGLTLSYTQLCVGRSLAQFQQTKQGSFLR